MKRTDEATAGLRARQAAAALVTAVIERRESLDRLDGEPALRGLDQRDAGLARAIALAALRNNRRIEAVFDRLWDRPPPKRALSLRYAMTVAAAQILFMNVPDHVAGNLAVADIAADPRSSRFAGFANAVLRRLARERENLMAATEEVLPFPDWLERALARDHGRERSGRIGRMIALEPNIDLRPNPAGSFDPSGMDLMELPLGHFRLNDRRPVTELPGYERGAWWVQDFAAALPAMLLGDVRGMRIADLCAAPGGKTMQLAAAGAKVTSVDISPSRLERLRQNLSRTGLSAEIVEADLLEWRPPELFDAVLLDAPCSATGTARRHPDVLWNKTAADVDTLVELQKAMIGKAAGMVRPGGLLVYCNCSLLKREGEDLVAALTREGLELEPVRDGEFGAVPEIVNRQGTLRMLPCHLERDPPAMGGMDGFFAARFRVAP